MKTINARVELEDGSIYMGYKKRWSKWNRLQSGFSPMGGGAGGELCYSDATFKSEKKALKWLKDVYPKHKLIIHTPVEVLTPKTITKY